MRTNGCMPIIPCRTRDARNEVLALLKEIRMKAQFLDAAWQAGFNGEQNALIAVNAEIYYSSMLAFNNES